MYRPQWLVAQVGGLSSVWLYAVGPRMSYISDAQPSSALRRGGADGFTHAGFMSACGLRPATRRSPTPRTGRRPGSEGFPRRRAARCERIRNGADASPARQYAMGGKAPLDPPGVAAMLLSMGPLGVGGGRAHVKRSPRRGTGAFQVRAISERRRGAVAANFAQSHRRGI